MGSMVLAYMYNVHVHVHCWMEQDQQWAKMLFGQTFAHTCILK